MSRFAAGRFGLRARNSARIRPHIPFRVQTPRLPAKPGVWVKLLQALEDGLANGGDPFLRDPREETAKLPDVVPENAGDDGVSGRVGG